MPAYNAALTIGQSIESVLQQTYQNWELVIINDASADDTKKIASEYACKDKRIRVFSNEKNRGVAATRNIGIHHAQGNLLGFLDSDDLWHKTKLEKQVRLMKDNGSIISFTGTSYITKAGRKSKYILLAKKALSHKELLHSNTMSCSSVMVRRSDMIPFPQGYMHEDYAVWLQIVKKAGQAHGLGEPLLIYRMGEATKSSNRIRSARMIVGVYRYVGYGRVASFLLMLRYGWHSLSKRWLIWQLQEQ